MHFHFATRTFLRHLHPGQKQLFIFDYTIQLWNIKFLIFMISYKNCMIERKVAVRITRFGYSVSPRLSPAVRERKEAPTAVGASVFRLHVFNPPTPRGVGPGQSAQHGAGVLISIHPPREGWDQSPRGTSPSGRDFNPPTPRGVGRLCLSASILRSAYFNPPTPRGVGRRWR